MNFARKKQLRNGVLLSVLAGTMLLSATAWAETEPEKYTGNGGDGSTKFSDKVNNWGMWVPNDGKLQDNNVQIENVKPENYDRLHNVYGGHAGSISADEVSGNSLTVSGSELKGKGAQGDRPESKYENVQIFGGETEGTGAVTGNSVTITDSSTVGGDDNTKGYVIGGRTEKAGAANENSVTVNAGSELKNVDVIGGDSMGGGDTDGNEVLITGEGTTVTGDVYGGHSRITEGQAGSAVGNTVTIKDGATVGSAKDGKLIFGAYNKGEEYTKTPDKDTEKITYSDEEKGKSIYRNSVTVKDSTVYGEIIGGVAGVQERQQGTGTTGAVIENSVTVDGSTVNLTGNGLMGGENRGTGDVVGNSLTITGKNTEVNQGDSAGVFGGSSWGKTGYVTENSVTISDGAHVTSLVKGGHDNGASNVTYNKVTVTGEDTTVEGDVFGGYTSKEFVDKDTKQDIKNNDVYINGGATVKGTVRGGKAEKKRVEGGADESGSSIKNNRVFIGTDENNSNLGAGYVGEKDSGKYYAVRGGATNGHDTVESNEVHIAIGSVIYGSVSGGYIDEGGDGVATQNKVYIDNSSVEGQEGLLNGIYGGRTLGSGTVSLNEVHISNSTISENIFGGSSEDPNSREGQSKAGGAKIDQNKVYIEENATITGNVYGGSVVGDSVAVDNEVHILTDSTVNGNVYGGVTTGTGDMTGNKAIIEGGTVNGDVYGGYTQSNAGLFSGNEVIIKEGTVTGRVAGVYVDRNVDAGQGSKAENNKVTIYNGVTVGTNVLGALNRVGDLEGNQVIIGGTVEKMGDESIIAAAVSTHTAADTRDKEINIANNSVTLLWDGQGNGDEHYAHVENSDIYGAYFTDEHKHEMLGHSGNAINFGSAELAAAYANDRENNIAAGDGVWRGTVKSLSNFDTMHYAQFDWLTNDVLVTVTDGEHSDLSLLTDVYVNNVKFNGGTRLAVGDKMTLLDIDTLREKGKDYAKGGDLKFHVLIDGQDKDEVTFTQGASTKGTIKGMVEDGDMILKVTALEAQNQNGPIAETRAMAMAFVNISEDLIHEVLNDLGRDHLEGIKTFAFGYGTKSTYDLGDGLKLNGWSFLTGIDNARHIGKDDEELNFTLFFETGTGNFRLYNTFYDGEGNATHFRGDGGMIYNGGGIAARFQKKNGVYYEGSVRGGVLKNNIGNGFMDGEGKTYGYNSENKYFGCHAGIGRIVSTGEHSVFNMYAKYFHTYTEKDNWELSNGDWYDLDGIKSDRVRVGGRVLTHKGHPNQYYYGLAYEYEFSGDVHLKASGAPVDADSLKGGTGILELGFNYKKDPDSPWSFDLNTKGYVGAREGVSAQLQATYTF